MKRDVQKRPTDSQSNDTSATRCNTLQHAATRCNTLQHTATHCNTLQHTATRCNRSQKRRVYMKRDIQKRPTEYLPYHTSISSLSYETSVTMSKVMCELEKRHTNETYKRDTQKRHTKETYKRDLQKRPTEYLPYHTSANSK